MRTTILKMVLKKQRHVTIVAQGGLKLGLICLGHHFKVEYEGIC